MAAKPKYNAPYHDNWAWSLAAMGATNEEIALAMGVSERTIMRWAKEHESFGKALGEGKGVSDAKVIRSLYERATGYEYEEEKKIIEYDKDGNVKPVKIEKTKKHVPPDVTAHRTMWIRPATMTQRFRFTFRIMGGTIDERENRISSAERTAGNVLSDLCGYLHLWRRCRRRKNLWTAVRAASIHEQSGLQRDYLPT